MNFVRVPIDDPRRSWAPWFGGRAEQPSDMYQTSIEHLSKTIYLTSIGNLSKTAIEQHRTASRESIEDLSNIYQAPDASECQAFCVEWVQVEPQSDIDRTAIDYQSSIYRTTIEHLYNTYRTAIDRTGTSFEHRWKSIEHVSTIDRIIVLNIY